MSVIKEMWFKYSSNFSSCGYFVLGEAKRIVRFLVEGSMWNISVKLFKIWVGGQRSDVVV